MASTNETLDQSVQISTREFAKFQLYQESSKPSFTLIAAIAESNKPNTCLFSSSSKWVINSKATDHMTGNSSLFSTF